MTPESINEDQISTVRTFLTGLQRAICDMLESHETSARFKADPWERAEGGGGVSCVLSGGEQIEKAGVMFSDILISKLPASASARHPGLAGAKARAMGVSVVVHPKNPLAPTAHLNVRLFSATSQSGESIWWFGGGYDLTPYYGFDEDCIAWHQTTKDLCDPFGEAVYADFKQACDAYFYLKHRDEQRGIGGIFYDDLNEWGFDNCFSFMQAVGTGFIKAYDPILARRLAMSYTEAQREFQLYRRGRYVEFNLVYDRGTLFGLQSGGRTESILVSLPNLVSWSYRPEFLAGSDELRLTEYFLKPRDWV